MQSVRTGFNWRLPRAQRGRHQGLHLQYHHLSVVPCVRHEPRRFFGDCLLQQRQCFRTPDRRRVSIAPNDAAGVSPGSALARFPSLAAVLLVGGLQLGCQANAPATGGVATQSHARATACPRPRDVLRLPRRGTLRGDIDGDGKTETVFVAVSRESPLRCRYFVVAHRQGSERIAALGGTAIRPNFRTQSGSRWPYLSALADIDRRAGLEILVTLDGGAAVQEVGVWTAHGRGLRHMPIEGAGSNDLFPYGGSGSGLAVVDCLRGPRSGEVIATYAERDGLEHGSLVHRKIFRVRGGEFRLMRSQRFTTKARLPEFPRGRGITFRSLEFRSCKTAFTRKY